MSYVSRSLNSWTREILLDLLKDVHFRDQFWQYFEIVTDDDKPLQYWNYDFKRSKIKDTEVTGLTIYLMEIHDFRKIDVDSLTNKFKGATSLVAVSQAGGGYEIPYGISPDIDPTPLAKFTTENPNLTFVACLDDDCDLEEAFEYSEVNLEKLRFLKFKTLIFGGYCTLHGVLKSKRLKNLYIGALADFPFDLLKTVHPSMLKELLSLSLNIKSGLELERFQFDSLKEAELLGQVSLRFLPLNVKSFELLWFHLSKSVLSNTYEPEASSASNIIRSEDNWNLCIFSAFFPLHVRELVLYVSKSC